MNLTAPIKVHVVALPLVCWGLRRLVESAQPHMEVVGCAASVAESLALLQQQNPDIVLLDLDGEGSLSVEALTLLCNQAPIKVLAVTGSAGTTALDQAVLAGARGVVQKRESPETLLKAVEKVHAGEIWIDRGATGRLFAELGRRRSADTKDPGFRKIAALTTRERQTIEALVTDVSARSSVISARLTISEHTLRNHLTSIYAKLGVSNRVELYAFATKHGLGLR